MIAKPGFPHRHNNDGTYDSICDTCYSTIAKANVEAELIYHEARHVCDPKSIFRVGHGSSVSRAIFW